MEVWAAFTLVPFITEPRLLQHTHGHQRVKCLAVAGQVGIRTSDQAKKGASFPAVTASSHDMKICIWVFGSAPCSRERVQGGDTLAHLETGTHHFL